MNAEYNDTNRQMQALIHSMDVLNDTVSAGIVDALNQGADIIVARQKALVPPSIDKHPSGSRSRGRLADAISKSSVVVTGRGRYQIKTGYMFRNAPDVALAGAIAEFGRAEAVGTRSTQNGKTDVRVGYIPARSHIRKGFDEAAGDAVQVSVNLLGEAVRRWGSTT